MPQSQATLKRAKFANFKLITKSAIPGKLIWSLVYLSKIESCRSVLLITPGEGGGVTTMYMYHLRGAFYRAENKFRVSFLVKSQLFINFGVSF